VVLTPGVAGTLESTAAESFFKKSHKGSAQIAEKTGLWPRLVVFPSAWNSSEVCFILFTPVQFIS